MKFKTYCYFVKHRVQERKFVIIWGLNSVTYAIQTYVNPLVEAGVIKLSIPDKPKSPKQLYYSVEREK